MDNIESPYQVDNAKNLIIFREPMGFLLAQHMIFNEEPALMLPIVESSSVEIRQQLSLGQLLTQYLKKVQFKPRPFENIIYIPNIAVTGRFVTDNAWQGYYESVYHDFRLIAQTFAEYLVECGVLLLILRHDSGVDHKEHQKILANILQIPEVDNKNLLVYQLWIGGDYPPQPGRELGYAIGLIQMVGRVLSGEYMTDRKFIYAG
jgi:hypothetical protein